jgi:hypothetical protein
MDITDFKVGDLVRIEMSPRGSSPRFNYDHDAGPSGLFANVRITQINTVSEELVVELSAGDWWIYDSNNLKLGHVQHVRGLNFLAAEHNAINLNVCDCDMRVLMSVGCPSANGKPCNHKKW